MANSSFSDRRWLPGVLWRNPQLAGRIPELDGIRGLAILLVLIHHYVAITLRVRPGSWQAYGLHSLDLTWSGVDLFFVLSGFLIGGVLLDARTSPNYYQTFYVRRIHRIFPVYYLWFVFFLIGIGFADTGHSQAVAQIFNRKLPLWSFALFLQNFAMAARGEFGGQWLAVTWSLAVEEQFYLLLPIAIRRLTVRSIWRLTITMIVGAPVVRIALLLAGVAYQGPYTLLPSRADALGWGVLLALALRDPAIFGWLQSHRRQVYPLSIALGIGSAAFTAKPVMSVAFMGAGYSCLALLYACVLLLAVMNPSPTERRLFRWRPLRELGTVAYAVYVFHQGINYLWHATIFGAAPRIDNWGSAGLTLISFGTVLALAAISWRFLEKPLMERAHLKVPYGASQVRAASASTS